MFLAAENAYNKDKAVKCNLSKLWAQSVTILIIQITGIFKTAMNPGIAQNVSAQFFLSNPWLVTKIPWPVAQALIITFSGQIQKMIIVAHYH